MALQGMILVDKVILLVLMKGDSDMDGVVYCCWLEESTGVALRLWRSVMKSLPRTPKP